MIQEERLKPMIKMAMFDKNEGKVCRSMIQYARTDYISAQLLKSFLSGSIAFVIACVLYIIYDMEKFMQQINGAYMIDLLTEIGMLYVVFLAVYLMATYIVYYLRYVSGRKKIKKYYKSLKEINKIYEREEHLKNPVHQEWE